MAPKGLRPGDTFEDAGRWFEVVAVQKDGNYLSKMTEKPKTEPKQPRPRRKA